VTTQLDFVITAQPDGTACGPTCLHAVYRYYGDHIPRRQVIHEVQQVEGGGTLAVFLALHALRRGYQTTIYTLNLQIFDPSWFEGDDIAFMRERLIAQKKAKRHSKLGLATEAYLEFLDRGGRLLMKDVTASLIARILRQGSPIITGLSATWLYRCKRERRQDMEPDDVAGEPVGHFVVIHGLDSTRRRAKVADPNLHMPYPASHQYDVRVERLVGAILLGIVTFDAKLLVVTPPVKGEESEPCQS
jgi:hypothetical protein